MLNALSEEGIYVSSGSACAKGAKGSSTLAAMNVPYPDNAIRFSFSTLTTKEELDELLRPENMIAPHKMPHKKY